MRLRSVSIAAFAAALALAAGCREDTGLRFSHALHAEEAACSDCHRGDEGLRTGMEPCKDCHEIDEQNPSEACLTCHTRAGDEDYAVSKAPRGRTYADVVFDHDPHEVVDCSRCHGATAGAENLAGVEFPGMDVCMGCHDGDQAPAECSTCHSRIRVGQKPPSHDGLWEKRHGKRGDLREATCRLCHPGPDACRTCHRAEKPRSHTLGWKDRSHGLEARHDRDNCRACHTATFCSDCHREAPRSHSPRNGWLASGHRIRGAAERENCRVCHTRTEASCLACHPQGY
ncbi:MAG: hypothetical protein D6708_16160 [Candidatus Dadabacteria bacterium]|nr:MAG: hypothetical protein D6708_16160 [Candidatus Dadabacteria bacterium]